MMKIALILLTSLLLVACDSVPVYDGNTNTANTNTAKTLSNNLGDMYLKTGLVIDTQYDAVQNFSPYNRSWRGEGFSIFHQIINGDLRIRIIPCGVSSTQVIEERIKTTLINEDSTIKYDSKCSKHHAPFN